MMVKKIQLQMVQPYMFRIIHLDQCHMILVVPR